MKTQISRDTFQTEQRYSGVYLQQGRMILDADWNELSDIEKARLVDALRHAIASGAPKQGGLRVYADPAGSTTIRIQPGTLYVDGVPARLDAAAPLAISAQPDYPVSGYTGQNQRLYADVWERTVTALEQSDLMDAGLHGADTATRTQTLLQVKWCANSVDPLVEASNPSIGTALLSLRLRAITSGGDACDPCASQVSVDERIGNYLFRVEVHDYVPSTQQLTLKWSRDNGSEACATAAMPSGFDSGDWSWEFFDDDTERLLGNHLATTTAKLRGLLKDSCVVPTAADEPKTYVRQWDGYLKINLASGSLSGFDRGVALYAGADADAGQGRVVYAGGGLKINLELMELALATSGKSFVPGDYWLAEVRESVHASGQYVLPPMPDMAVPAAGEAPRGVKHHYLFLGELAANFKLVAQNDAFSRRMNFPALTNLLAADVGFTEKCNGLFGGAVNVQQALDKLCEIGAEDIAYLLPGCSGNTIKEILKLQFDPNGDNKLTVQAALDTLLCQLGAASLPYAPPTCASSPSVKELLGISGADNKVAPVLDKLLCGLNADTLPLNKTALVCSDLKAAGVDTVQDALEVLCGKSGGGCAVVATSASHLQTLLKDFHDTSSATDLWVCLKAGSYAVNAAEVALSGKRSLRISGAGAESVLISVSGDVLSLGAGEVILENLAMTFEDNSRLAIVADSVRVQGCHFSRTASTPDLAAMIGVGGSDTCQLVWRDNILEAEVKLETSQSTRWAEPDVVGDAKISAIMLALEEASLVGRPKDYNAALSKAATALVGMSATKRQTWKANLDKLTSLDGTGFKKVKRGRVQPGIQALKSLLLGSTMTNREAVTALQGVTALRVRIYDDYALRLEDTAVGGVIEGNRIEGWLLLGNGVSGYSVPAAITSVSASLSGDLVKTGGENLSLQANRITALKANIPAGSGGVSDASLMAQVNGHERLTLVANHFEDADNLLTARNLLAQGNHWYGSDSDLGCAVVDRAVFSGNLVDDSQDISRISITVRPKQEAAQYAESGNLLLEVVAIR